VEVTKEGPGPGKAKVRGTDVGVSFRRSNFRRSRKKLIRTILRRRGGGNVFQKLKVQGGILCGRGNTRGKNCPRRGALRIERMQGTSRRRSRKGTLPLTYQSESSGVHRRVEHENLKAKKPATPEEFSPLPGLSAPRRPERNDFEKARPEKTMPEGKLSS